jgi:GH15 family glucan-1,4-alpha-glucosidase
MAIATGDLITERSLAVLRDGQSRSGAFVASPTFRVYNFGWLRDGAFCAHALDRVGHSAASGAWHRWVQAAIERYRARAEAVIVLIATGEVPPGDAMLPARYTLEGDIEHEDPVDPWPNYQIDGYGMWLWSLEQHLAGRVPDPEQVRTIELVGRYLAASWRLPCWSCWEEFNGGEHASTLASACAGLDVAARLTGESSFADEAERVRAELVSRYVTGGYVGLSPGDERVDSSILWLGVPFGVFPADDPLVVATVAEVKRQLSGPSGGVYRYRGDTYYGGGEWLLLTSSLAWHDAVAGDAASAGELRAWVRAQARENGDLPEQVTRASQLAEEVEPWLERWGPVATPLLWSHAMFLISEAVA